jgi:methylmalonyl-CoA mutase C-terminal domain/subunit
VSPSRPEAALAGAAPGAGPSRPLRVLLAKVGLDGHDRGARVVARLLRDAGHEVLYLGRRQEIPAVVKAALEEDIDVVGVSILSGTHRTLVPALVAELRREGVEVPVVVGGTILRQEIADLLAHGVARVFPVGTPLAELRAYFDALAAARPAGA